MTNIDKIKIRYDCAVDIATAHSHLAKRWQNKTWSWSDLVRQCAEPKRTGETVAEYLRMTREEQSNIKDVGGFVGGYLSHGTRKASNVLYRSVVTLDIDFGTMELWDDFTMNYDVAALIYSTHKHTPENPRLRLILPANRQISPAEYEPVSRYWAAKIGIELFDHTTHDINRLFYWPSVSADGEYVFNYQDGPAFDVDAILTTYKDYHDVSEWPMSSRESEVITREMRKASDPTEKPGLIGAFCRAYSIEEAIEKFLPDVYERTATDGRYTYRAGSVAGGLVTYEGKFAYSHHETDPTSGMLCNAFDLCRVHLYGLQDDGTTINDVTKRPSYAKMLDFAAADNQVRLLIASERQTDFEGIDLDGNDNPDGATAESNDWMTALEYDRKGTIKSTINNISSIIDNAPGLRGHIYLDMLRNNISVEGGLPWDSKAKTWGNRDDANLRGWLERNYDVSGKDRVRDALDMVVTRHRRHPIREYFESLKWDGVGRLERMIIDYVGAEDTELNRAITRIHFTAAVARIMSPGCKYDYCLILAGPQGVGKSTLIAIMGGEYYKDGLTTMEGKEGAEQLRGSHLIEIGELDGMKRSEISAVKQFISARSDEYRPAYGIHKEIYPRQCVFFGTTNEQYFLKDETGNRRFPIIPVRPELRRNGAHWFDMLTENRDQLWAEAVEYWRRGEKLYLSDDLDTKARQIQDEYLDSNTDELQGILSQYLDALLPEDWDMWDLVRRRAFFRNPDPLEVVGKVRRERVCAAEFICERMGREITDKEYKYLARKVCRLIADMGWERLSTTKHAQSLYGVQKGFRRPTKIEDEINII